MAGSGYGRQLQQNGICNSLNILYIKASKAKQSKANRLEQLASFVLIVFRKYCWKQHSLFHWKQVGWRCYSVLKSVNQLKQKRAEQLNSLMTVLSIYKNDLSSRQMTVFYNDSIVDSNQKKYVLISFMINKMKEENLQFFIDNSCLRVLLCSVSLSSFNTSVYQSRYLCTVIINKLNLTNNFPRN